MEVQKISVSTSLEWIKRGFNLYKPHWLMLSGIYFGLFIASLILKFIPLVGYLTQLFGFAICTIYFFILFKQIETANKIDIQAGFSELVVKLKENILLLLAFSIPAIVSIIGGLFFSFAMSQVLPSTSIQDTSSLYAMSQIFSGALSGGSSIIFALGIGLIFLVILLVVAALYVGAGFCIEPVVFRKMDLVEAFKASWKASIINVIPLTVYGVVLTIIIILSVIPLGIGLLVTGPVGMASVYLASRDMLKE